LTFEVVAGCAGAVERTIEVGADDFMVVGDFAFEGGALGPRDAGVGDEDVEAAVELFDLGVDGGFDGVAVGYVDLVRFT